MKKQLSSHAFAQMYKKMGINVNELGCVMLDIDGSKIENELYDEELYVSGDKKKFWIKGYVAGKNPHVTLLYGLLKPATVYKAYIAEVLKDWSLKSVIIDKVDYFDSSLRDENYYCIIAKIKVTPKLQEGHDRLEFIPHINTFTSYVPHMTIAYVKKDKKIRDRAIRLFNRQLKGKKLQITGINLGEKKL